MCVFVFVITDVISCVWWSGILVMRSEMCVCVCAARFHHIQEQVHTHTEFTGTAHKHSAYIYTSFRFSMKRYPTIPRETARFCCYDDWLLLPDMK